MTIVHPRGFGDANEIPQDQVLQVKPAAANVPDEAAPAAEKPHGKMRLRLVTGEKDEISVRYKEIAPMKKTPLGALSHLIDKMRYRKVAIQAEGEEKPHHVLVNVGSLGKQLKVDRASLLTADAKSLKIYVKYQAGIKALRENGLSNSDAKKMAKTINQRYPTWTKENSAVYAKKEGSQPYTMEFDPSKGHVIVHLKSKAFIGKGGHGKVTKSIEFVRGTLLAQKSALKTEKHDPERKQAELVREGAMMQKYAGKPFVLQGKHYGHADKGSIVAEYMSGGDLKGVTMGQARLKLTPEERLSIAKQSVGALFVLHTQNSDYAQGVRYAHRDIKPGNFLFTHDTNGKIVVKVADFGLMRDTSKGTSVTGTVDYSSTSKLQDYFDDAMGKPLKNPTQADDMFSLGVMLFEIEYGRKPNFTKDIRVMDQEIEKLGKELSAIGKKHKLSDEQLEELGDIKALDDPRLEKFPSDKRIRAFVENKIAVQAELQEIKNKVASLYKEVPAPGTIDHLIYSLLQNDRSKQLTARAAQQAVNQLQPMPTRQVQDAPDYTAIEGITDAINMVY